jgi:hypothetical protein
MNRRDAEDLARAYCLRNVGQSNRARWVAERIVLEDARARYGSGLTRASEARIRRALRDSRP